MIKNGSIRIDENKVKIESDAISIYGREFPDVKSLDWLEEAVKEKLGRQPDPDTGLLPCGCGGKAIRAHIPHETKTKLTCVACETCFVMTPYLEGDEAKDVWNRAMGLKEA